MNATTERACLRAARFFVCAAVAGSILVFETVTADSFGLPKLAVAWAAVAGAAGCWAVAAQSRGRWLRPDRFTALVGALVAATAVATVTSVARIESLIGSYERYGGLATVVLGAALALLIVAVRQHDDGPGLLAWLAAAIVGAAVVSGVYVLLQSAGIDVVHWKEASGAAVRFQGGTMGNSDFEGGLLGIAVPFLLSGLVRWRRAARPLAAVSAALMVDVAALGVTRSRGGVLAAAAGTAAVGVLLRGGLPRRVRQAGIVLGVAAVIGGAALVFVPGLTKGGSLNQADLLRTKSVAARGREWSAAAKVFVHRPILGTGPDTFEYRFPRYRSAADAAELGTQIADKPHNVFLEHATDTGVVGLAAWLALLAFVLGRGRRRLRGLDGVERALLAAFLAGLWAYLAQALVSIDVVALALCGWACIGAVAASTRDPAPMAKAAKPAKTAKTANKRRPAHERWGPIGVAAVGVVAAAVALGPTVPALAADASAASAQRTRSRTAAARDWQDAVDHNPLQVSYRLGSGFAAEAQGAEAADPDARRRFLQHALDRYNQARRMAPANLLAVLGLARTTALYAEGVDPSRFSEADGWWARAVSLDPLDADLHFERAKLLNTWANNASGDVGLRRRAIAEIAKAVKVKPTDAQMWVTMARIQNAVGDHAGALASAKRALAADPGNAEAKQLLTGR